VTSADPLPALDEVAWHRLYHAYGPAGDVPAQLRALSDPRYGRDLHALAAISAARARYTVQIPPRVIWWRSR